MIKRYSDEVPYEKRKYWYFTTHGLGPGTIPGDLKVLEVREGRNNNGTLGDYICLDGVLNTDELKFYDLKEMSPPEDDNVDICKFFTLYLYENGIKPEDIWEENSEIHIVLDGNWKTTHLKCKHLMKDKDYYERDSKNIDPSDQDTYNSEHIFIKCE